MSSFKNLSGRERRLVQYAGIGLAIYLVVFVGYKFAEKRRAQYNDLKQEVQALRERTKPYKDRVLVVQKVMEDFHMDPARLKKDTVVADASAAIQKAAKSGGLQLGPIRETPARGSGKALATLQLETTGQVTAALTFLAGLNTIGYPVVVDSVQFSSDKGRPDQLKMNLIILILDFDQQKASQEASHA